MLNDYFERPWHGLILGKGQCIYHAFLKIWSGKYLQVFFRVAISNVELR